MSMDACEGCSGDCSDCGMNSPRSLDCYDDEDEIRSQMFANPGSGSALRAAARRNPRNLPCPTCGAPNRLTPADLARGYQCDECADRAEGKGGY